MKKTLMVLLVAALMVSCSSSYQFVQIQEFKVNGQNTLVTEDNDVKLDFSTCMSKEGIYAYSVYNKTDGFLYIDKSKSFLIDEYGLAHNFVDAHASFNEKKGNNTFVQKQENEDMNYLEYSSDNIMIVPPKSSKPIFALTTQNTIMLRCDLPQFPSEPFSVSTDDTLFTIVTTYRTDRTPKETTLFSTITRYKITNTPEYVIARYVLRPPVCVNMREPGKTYPPDGEQIYDIYYDVLDNAVTIPYFVLKSSNKYYEHKDEYRYSIIYDGYLKIY